MAALAFKCAWIGWLTAIPAARNLTDGVSESKVDFGPGYRVYYTQRGGDLAEQLRTPEEMAAYLDAWLAEAPDDAAGIARALGDIARAKGMSQVARNAGLSRESLYKALGKNRNPSFAKVLKVARALARGGSLKQWPAGRC